MKEYKLKIKGLFLFFFLFAFINIQAQDLEPRLTSNMPIGTNIAVASYSFSSGNIMLDNTLPIEDLESELNAMVIAYVRGFKLFNKLTKIDAVIPYAISNYSGIVESVDTTDQRHGFGDPSFRISMILLGEKALAPRDFVGREQKKFKLAALARVTVPLGQYNESKLINLGANRYSLRLGLAGSYQLTKKLNWELYFKSCFFTKNSDFFNGNTSKQKPLLTFQTHFSYEFKPGIWAAVSFGKSHFGETVVNGIEKDNLQKNTRSGIVFSYSFKKGHSLKALATTGVTTRYGADFTTFALAYQYLWFDKKGN